MNKLALFFTRNTSLKDWYDSGLFYREKALYEEHIAKSNFSHIYWVTYGAIDLQLSEQLKEKKELNPNITILQAPKILTVNKITQLMYSFLAPWIHHKVLRGCHVYKSNQLDGAWTAFLCKILYSGVFYLRTGYTLSKFLIRQKRSKFKVHLYQSIERLLYRWADCSSVSSNDDKKYLLSLGVRKKIFVLGNFIDSQLFKLLPGDQREDTLVYIGRHNQQKNLFNLLTAVKKCNLKIDLYGAGELTEELKQFCQDHEIKAAFKGLIKNEEIPQLLSKYKYYILTSHYEGMPKTLLEAMACGKICIGTKVEGILEVIEHNKSGYLAKDTDSSSIADTIKHAQSHATQEVSMSAIKTIHERFSLNAVTSMESKLLSFSS